MPATLRLRRGGPFVLYSLVLSAATHAAPSVEPADTAETASAELQSDPRYEAGTRVKLSALGVSFVVPKDWFVRRLPGEEVIKIASLTNPGVGVVFARRASIREVISLNSGTQELGEGVMLYPVGTPEVDGQRTTLRHAGGAYVSHALALVGSEGNGVYFAFLGPREQADDYAALLEGIGRSARIEAPNAPAGLAGQWTSRLSGRMLAQFQTYNSGFGGGGLSSKRALHLCSDGSFLYQSESSVSMNVDGMSAFSGRNTGGNGRWWIDEASEHQAVLWLEWDDGALSPGALRLDKESNLYVNEDHVFWGESDTCR